MHMLHMILRATAHSDTTTITKLNAKENCMCCYIVACNTKLFCAEKLCTWWNQAALQRVGRHGQSQKKA